MEKKAQNVWVLMTRSAEIPGQWVAHCLALDIVSQGVSIPHAFKSACEAIVLAVDDDLKNGLNPFERPPAPDEEWEPLHRLLKHSVSMASVPEEQRDRIDAAAAQLCLELVVHTAEQVKHVTKPPPRPRHPVEEAPKAKPRMQDKDWWMVNLQRNRNSDPGQHCSA